MAYVTVIEVIKHPNYFHDSTGAYTHLKTSHVNYIRIIQISCPINQDV